MPKMTVVTLPATMLDSHKQIRKKKKEWLSPFIKVMISKIYGMLVSLVDRKNGILGVLGFLLSRVLIMGEFAPVGLAFFVAMAQIDGKHNFTLAFWTILGIVSGGNYDEIGIYVFSISLYSLIIENCSYKIKRLLIAPIIVFIGVLFAGFIINFYKGAALYGFLLVLFEAGTCMVLSYIFMYGAPLLKNWMALSYEEKLTSERLSCMVILLATAVAGVGNIMVFEYSIRNIVASVLVMVMAFAGGAGFSTVMGVVLGLIIGISDGNASLVISLYALAGVLAGGLRQLGKMAVIVGFILGSMIIMLYFGQDHELNRILVEYLIGGGVFLIIPRKWLLLWKKVTCARTADMAKETTELNKVVVKIKEVADIFSELAVIFTKKNRVVTEKNHDDKLAKTLSAVGEKLCANCTKRSQCWEVDFYRTYHGILELVSQVEARPVELYQLPAVFQENCIKRKELLETVQHIAECNRMIAFCQKRNMDNQQMVMEQMKATSLIISGLIYEIKKVEYMDQELSLALQEKAGILKCPLEGVQVTGLLGGKRIEAWKKTCNGNRDCMNTILPLAAGLTKEKMILHTECGNEEKKQNCKLVMQVGKRLVVETGMMSLPKKGEGVCGDTCAVVELNQGKIALILSDGMGSGTQAEEQSKTAIHFLQKLLVAGFDTDVAVKTINSLLLLQSSEESFVTIDIAVVDTYSGEVEFLKIGSAPSFIKRVREVATIKSTSLPVGILGQIEIEPVKSLVVGGDFIVMVSDGIVDVPQDKLAKGNWLPNFLRQSVQGDAQTFASHILAQAQKMSNYQVADDMTVLVAKISQS